MLCGTYLTRPGSFGRSFPTMHCAWYMCKQARDNFPPLGDSRLKLGGLVLQAVGSLRTGRPVRFLVDAEEAEGEQDQRDGECDRESSSVVRRVRASDSSARRSPCRHT